MRSPRDTAPHAHLPRANAAGDHSLMRAVATVNWLPVVVRHLWGLTSCMAFSLVCRMALAAANFPTTVHIRTIRKDDFPEKVAWHLNSKH